MNDFSFKHAASGCDYQRLVRVHMIAGLTEGKCSMIGAWGEATLNGNLIQLRALGNENGDKRPEETTKSEWFPFSLFLKRLGYGWTVP
jgi:hypothetical protein